LNTDNLTSFHTGTVEELFKDEITVKKRKSKIHFLLDQSGSMNTKLSLDSGLTRGRLLVKVVQSMTDILDEVKSYDGLDVSYEVWFFEGSLIIPKEDWKKEYCPDGGTNLCASFTKVLEKMKDDYEIDGKRIVVVVTDGDVSREDIQQMKDKIIEFSSDVRCMILPIGAMPGDEIVKIISDGKTILTESSANKVMLETIQEML
jgi:Mg-chelatase subunit ChlD